MIYYRRKEKGDAGMFLKVGHRGARAYETENTLASFGTAIKLGANAIELDIRQSGDGELIVCHDDNLKRIFGIDIPVGGASLKELKDKTEGRIVTLEESLKFIGRKAEKVLVELKEAGYEGKVLKQVSDQNLDERVIIVSFLEEALAAVRKRTGTIETGLIYVRSRNPVETALKLEAQYLVPLFRFIHTRDVERAHKSGLKLVVWTINTREEAEQFMAKGVDGIATDKPDIFSE